ncbi:outer membrane protein transport protein [Roseovarius aestuarii]|nr:outer membrane protein transport protein [Roseovarius aestuarii]
MKSTVKTLASAATLTTATLSMTPLHAGGLDRTGTPIDLIFETGNYAELSFGMSSADVTGRDTLGNSISNVAGDFSVVGGGLKMQFTEKFSFSLIFDQPYGADVKYGGNPATTMLGGTMATADSKALTTIFKYNITDRYSVYAGPRVVEAQGEITLSGLAYGPLNGYNVKFNSDRGLGYVVGTAYEIPDIALRASLTYHSAVELDLGTVQTAPGGVPTATPPTTAKIPQSLKLAVQSGVAPNTLVFGSLRWSEWSKFQLDTFGPTPNLADVDDSVTFEIGVGRRFSDKFSARVSYIYEMGGSDDLVSPLTPVNGQHAMSVGGKYQINDQLSLSGGVRYTWLGNAQPETGTPDVARASFSGNHALSAGLKIGVNF